MASEPIREGFMKTAPRFAQINLVCRDVETTVRFYALLGVPVPAIMNWPAGSGRQHAEVLTEGDHAATVEFDNVVSVRSWAVQWTQPTGIVIGLAVDAAADVDELHGRVVGAGHRSLQAPYDAFWGALYAVVADPDGHAVGLMGPPA